MQWVGYHRDAGARLKQSGDRPAAGLPAWLREDRLTGLHSRAYFEELLQRDWSMAQRESHEIGLVLFDIDDLGPYNEIFDKAAGDACIRRVARVIAGVLPARSGDLIGRWEGGTFAVLTQGDSADKAGEYARVVVQRVRDLLIHHPRGANGRYVTLSAGVACLVPPRELALAALSNAARAALKRAKANGRNAVDLAQAADLQIDALSAPAGAGARHRSDERDHPECRVIEVVALVEAHAPPIVQREGGSRGRAQARRRIGGRIGECHAQMQVLAALEHHRAGELRNIDAEALQREARPRPPGTRRLRPGNVRERRIACACAQALLNIGQLELRLGQHLHEAADLLVGIRTGLIGTAVVAEALGARLGRPVLRLRRARSWRGRSMSSML